jgi:TolB-like protein/class 3 adenylate cyclase/Tfp pilus assembly protein PilF
MAPSPARKLTVILHADVVGSTKLVQINESIAHERIRNVFQRLSETTRAYGGTVHEIRGDALVAEFSRASDSVCAALAFQSLNNEHNAGLEGEIRPQIRIGISLGEVIVADGTITGAGVVMAQRLEQLAEPGGVVVQGSVSETVPTRLPLDFDSLGEKSLKGFDQPVRACQAILQPGAAIPEPEAGPGADTGPVSTDVPDTSPKPCVGSSAELPSIAVLPFDNLSSDPEQQFFADGIAEDIITALSKFHGLLVIARNSSFTYRGVSVDIRQVGEELDVQYVLEGSVRSAGNKVRITAQLIEAASGNHVWADRFDRSLEDVFEVQDEITAMVTSTVGQQVRVAEITSSLKRDRNDLGVRDLVARAQWHMDQMTREDFHKAREFSDLALERHPGSVGALSIRAYVNIMEFVYGWGELTPAELISNAAEAAREGVRIDPDDEAARTFLAAVSWLIGNHDAAIEEAETVIRLNPNYAAAKGVLGVVYAYCGADSYQLAVSNLEQAIRLSPNDPWLQFYFSQRGTAEFWMENYEEAVKWYQKSLQRNPNLPNALRSLTATWALLGEMDKAREALNEVFRIEPDYTIEKLTLRTRQVFKYEKDFEHLIKGLRLAGTPEN